MPQLPRASEPLVIIARGKPCTEAAGIALTQRELIIALIAAVAGYVMGRVRNNLSRPDPRVVLPGGSAQRSEVAPPASGGVATAMADPSATWSEVQQQAGNWTVTMTAAGDRKINVIKSVRQFTGMGLKQAKDLVEAPMPVVVVRRVSEETARRAVADLKASGASARMGMDPRGADGGAA